MDEEDGEDGASPLRAPLRARALGKVATPSSPVEALGMPLNPRRIPALAAEYAGRHPRDILALALREYARPRDLVQRRRGRRARRHGGQGRRPFRVFSLDTGRLHPETYQFLERVREHYGIAIETFFPQPEAVQKLVREKGLFSFYKDGHKECCGIRKVEPLVRALDAAARRG